MFKPSVGDLFSHARQRAEVTQRENHAKEKKLGGCSDDQKDRNPAFVRTDTSNSSAASERRWQGALEKGSHRLDQTQFYRKNSFAKNIGDVINSANHLVVDARDSDNDVKRAVVKLNAIVQGKSSPQKQLNTAELRHKLMQSPESKKKKVVERRSRRASHAQLIRRNSMVKKKKKKKANPSAAVKNLYKQYAGKLQEAANNTGVSVAVAVVNETAKQALAALGHAKELVKSQESWVGSHDLKNGGRHFASTKDLFKKVEDIKWEKAEDIPAPDLPLLLPRGRLLSKKVFILGKYMDVEILRVHNDTVRYEVDDGNHRHYVVEITERKLYDLIPTDVQAGIDGASLNVKLRILIQMIGFQLDKRNRRRKQLAVVTPSHWVMEKQYTKTQDTNEENGAKEETAVDQGISTSAKKLSGWVKVRNLSTKISEDKIRKKIEKNSNDVASIVALGLLKAREKKYKEAVAFLVKAVRVTGIAVRNETTGRHALQKTPAFSLARGSTFGAKFWSSLAEATFHLYLVDLRIEVLNVALDASEIAARFLENLASENLWILRGRIHECLGLLDRALELYEHCITHFQRGKTLDLALLRAAAVAKRLGRSHLCINYYEHCLLTPPKWLDQADILLQLSRSHEQSGNMDTAADGMKQVYKVRRQESKQHIAGAMEGMGVNMMVKLRAAQIAQKSSGWKAWIQDYEVWQVEADRYFNEGVFAIAIDMYHRALTLRNSPKTRELRRQFVNAGVTNQEAEDSEIAEMWWKAAVCARHLGELHTASKACAKALLLNPGHKKAANFQKSWLNFLENDSHMLPVDEDLILDAHYLPIDNMPQLSQQVRRLSITGSEDRKKQRGVLTGTKTKVSHKSARPSLSSTVKPAKIARRPRSAAPTRPILDEKSSASPISKVTSRQEDRSLKLVGTALRRLALMSRTSLNGLRGTTAKVTAATHASPVHSFIAAILIEEGSMTLEECRSATFMRAVDTLGTAVDVGALLRFESKRPSLHKLREQMKSPSSAHSDTYIADFLSLSLKHNPNNLVENRDGRVSLRDANGNSINRERMLEIERIHHGRLSRESRFDYLQGHRKCGGRRLNNLVERVWHSHRLAKTTKHANSSKRSPQVNPRSGASRRSRECLSMAKVPKWAGALTSLSRNHVPRSRKRSKHRLRKVHALKRRHLTVDEEQMRHYEANKPQIVLMVGEKFCVAKDPILMSRVVKSRANESKEKNSRQFQKLRKEDKLTCPPAKYDPHIDPGKRPSFAPTRNI